MEGGKAYSSAVDAHEAKSKGAAPTQVQTRCLDQANSDSLGMNARIVVESLKTGKSAYEVAGDVVKKQRAKCLMKP